MVELPALPPLRAYQARAYRHTQAAARELVREKGRDAGYGILVQGPTGMGKTRLALEFAFGALKKGHEVLWLAPRKELVEQPAERLWEYGMRSIRIVSAGRVTGDPHAKLTVASIQTLLARDFAPPARVVVFDEARHYVAAEWNRVAAKYRGAVRLGLDATPVRLDGAPLGDLFDRLVVAASVTELQRDGWLVPCAVFGPSQAQDKLEEDPVDAYARLAPGRRAIVFCATVDHARAVADAMTARGFRAESVDGTTAPDIRRAALKRLAAGELDVVTNCNLFLEGVDVPAVEVVIVARGCSSEAAWLQMGGRGLRPSPATGKTRMLLIDLRGHFWNHGFLEEDRTYHLEGCAIRRASTLPGIVQCKACHAWGRGARPCSMCGAKLPPPPRPKVKRSGAVTLQQQERRRAQPDAEKRAALERLIGKARAEGANPWRAKHLYKAAYGEEPPRAWMVELTASPARRVVHRDIKPSNISQPASAEEVVWA